jgi:hypothetical protein
MGARDIRTGRAQAHGGERMADAGACDSNDMMRDRDSVLGFRAFCHSER